MTQEEFEHRMATDPKFYAENHDPTAKWCDCEGEVCVCQKFTQAIPNQSN